MFVSSSSRRAPTDYVELHTHSAFSFLDGASLPEELVARAAQLGHHTLALTDHDGLHGSLAFAHAARSAGIRPITGAEITLEDGAHLTLLAEDARGYANLCRLITLAHADTRPHPARPALSARLERAALAVHSEGLVCLSGCARDGLLPRAIRAGTRAALDALAGLIRDFGRANVRVEVQRPRTRGDRHLMRDLVRLADHAGVDAVATGNVHAHSPRRALLQDALVAIRHRLTLDACEGQRRGNRQAVLRPPAAMADLFSDHPETLTNSARLAERLRFDLTRDLGYRIPDFWSHASGGADGELARVCIHRLGARYPNAGARRAARVRLDEELALIAHHGLAGFFLLHRDILELAQTVAAHVRPAGSARRWLAPGRGRGSSVGSIVCYLIGLSHVDPVANNLFLGRFLSRDMVAAPDIDLDFPRDVRSRLIAAIIERYGSRHAALVAAFPTFRLRMAIRELGTALALPHTDLTRLARLADGWSAPQQLREEILRLPDGPRLLRSPRWRALAFLAEQAAGLPRHLSQHPGGMIVSSRPLVDMVPVVPAATAGRQLCQWDKNSCADAGFVKIDLLGLGMLSALEECIGLIADARGERVDLTRIRLDDPKVYGQITAADTLGVFQIESRAQMQSLLQTRPQNLDELTIQVALVRPGPVSGGAVHPYVTRRRALRADPTFVPPYDHPLLEGPLRETLGVVVFQEQVLEVAIALAGFTPGRAEALRRAMSRTRSREAMVGLWREFHDGARARGVPEQTTRTVFTKLVGFANFGFPKAHAAAFAVLAYQSAWLRHHYPAEYLTALLNAQPMGFYPPASLVRDAQRHGVRVQPVCVNRSQVACTIDTGRPRIGLGYVRALGAQGAQRVVAERARGGDFTDLADLAARCDLRADRLVQLVRSGACDAFGDRRALAWQLNSLARPRSGGDAGALQLALPLPSSSPPPLPPLSRAERTLADHETTGLSTGWHLMAIIRPSLPAGTLTAAQAARMPSGSAVSVAGLVTARQRPQSAGGVVFLLLEDETGMVNCIVRPAVYERYRAIVRAQKLVAVRGRLDRRGRAVNVVADMVATVEPPAQPDMDDAAERLARLRAAAPAGQHFGRGRR